MERLFLVTVKRTIEWQMPIWGADEFEAADRSRLEANRVAGPSTATAPGISDSGWVVDNAQAVGQ